MIAPGFLLFTLAFIAWNWAQLSAAFRALHGLTNSQAEEIDMEYVRSDTFKARQVRDGKATASYRFVGDGVLEEGTHADSVVSDGALTLRKNVVIKDFADSTGEMRVEQNSAIHGRATSSAAIRLGRGVIVRSCTAPEITTPVSPSTRPQACSPQASSAQASSLPRVEIPDKGRNIRFRQLSSDTWVYEGDFSSSEPVILTDKLIVLGSFSAPASSELKADLKANGNVQIGEGSVLRGRIVADNDISLGAGTRFTSLIYAGNELRLSESVRGEGETHVVAYATKRVYLSPDILVRGKIASGGEVVSL